jgi:hypothetical protein
MLPMFCVICVALLFVVFFVGIAGNDDQIAWYCWG